MSNPSFFVLREVEARLAAAHPAAFTTPAPLALDVFDRLKAAHPEFGSSKLSAFLGRWMSSRAYLKALIEGSWRIDLDGTAVEGISDDARVEALARLQARPVGDPRDRL